MKYITDKYPNKFIELLEYAGGWYIIKKDTSQTLFSSLEEVELALDCKLKLLSANLSTEVENDTHDFTEVCK